DVRANAIAGGAHRFARVRKPKAAFELNEPIERDPAHELRIGVMARRSAHLPNARIGACPQLAYRTREAQQQIALVSVERAAAFHETESGEHDLPVNVELKLIVRGVSDPHRFESAVALQMRQLALGQRRLAVDVVEHLQARLSEPGGVQQPTQEGARFGDETQIDEGLQYQRGVAQPAVAIVPIARTAGTFRQRSGGGGDDSAGQAVGQQLEGDRATQHRFSMIASVAALVTPALPPPHRVVPPLVHGSSEGAEHADIVLAVVEDELMALAGAQS